MTSSAPNPPPASWPLPQDDEVLAFIARSTAFYPADAFLGGVAQSRAWYDRYAAAMARPLPPEVTAFDFSIPGAVAGPAIAARRYRHQSPAGGTTVLYIHGGGFVLGGLDSHADVCAGLCQLTGLDVVASSYRLAPEHSHPAQLDDVQAAFAHLQAQGERVLLCGDSAGANLIAGLCVRLAARGQARALAQILGQVLIYPGLGGDAAQGSYLSRAHAPMLTAQESAYYFAVRTASLPPDQQHQPELHPLRAASLRGTPPTLVVTADIDPLRDDGAQYAQRLRELGIPVHYRNEPELVHGYLRARHTSTRAAASFAAIAQGLRAMADGRFYSENYMD
jgi:acetyl esterase